MGQSLYKVCKLSPPKLSSLLKREMFIISRFIILSSIVIKKITGVFNVSAFYCPSSCATKKKAVNYSYILFRP